MKQWCRTGPSPEAPAHRGRTPCDTVCVCVVNWRAMIGYRPLIIEFADVMTDALVLALPPARDFNRPAGPSRSIFTVKPQMQVSNHILFYGSDRVLFFFFPQPICNMAEVCLKMEFIKCS